jgi:hypothetical protein
MPEDNPARKSFEAGTKTVREAMQKGTDAAEHAAGQAERSYSSTAEGLRDFNAKMMELAQANTMASLNFFAELPRAKGPTEAFELWSRHAQDHIQRSIELLRELATLGQRIATSSAEPLTRGFDQTIRRAS